LLVASALFAVPASLPAAASTLAFVAPGLVNDVSANLLVGAVWFVLVNLLVVLNVKVTARFQEMVTTLEVGILLALGILLVAHGLEHPVARFSLSWFMPWTSGGPSVFIDGMIVAVFLFWGWDVTANLGEETQNGGRTTGWGGVVGMLVILALFELLQVGMQLVLTPKQIADAGPDLLDVLAASVMPRPWSSLASLVVILSVIGTLETQLIQVGRTLFSMARDRAISERFSRLHPRFDTPWLATLVVGTAGLLEFAIAAWSPTISQLMGQLINALGFLIAVYYGLAGFACAWHYRVLTRGPRAFLLCVAWPAASALFLWIVAAAQLLTLPWYVDAVPLVTLALGVIPFVYYREKRKRVLHPELPLPNEARLGVGDRSY
jgi:amino acid transporter